MRTFGTLVPSSLLLLAACSSAPKDETPRPEEATGAGAPETPMTQEELGEALAQDVETLSLREQKKVFLVEQYLANAAELRDQLHLQEAEQELLRAYELDPDNLRVKEMLEEVGAMLGREASEANTLIEQINAEFAIRVQQLKAEAQDNVRQGKIALSRGDYDHAIEEFSMALNNIRWAPYSIDWGGIDEEAAALLERARADRTAATETQRLDAQRQAHEDLRLREDAERARREAIVTNILDQSIDAFEHEEYDEAMDLADQVLRREPRNEQATQIRDAAFRAGREAVRSDYIDAKREQFARWKEMIQEMRIPWTNVITLPDADEWRRITELRMDRRGLDLTQMVSPSDLALRQQLSQSTVLLPGIEEEESLSAVVDIVRQFTGLPLVVDQRAEDAVIDAGNVFDLNIENRVTVEQALNLITSIAGEEVVWTIRHDAVLITTKEQARGKPVIYNHDVQDLIMGLTDFTGPRIDRLRLLDDLEDDDGGGPFGGILESPRLIEIEDLSALIQENVAVGTWEDDGVYIEPGEGFITIVHSPEIQGQVKEFLEDLRRFTASLVTIESKFMTVADNWIQEIGVDFRGLDGIELTDVTNGLEDMSSAGFDNGGTGSTGEGAAGPPSAGFFYDDGQDGDFRGRTENYFGSRLGSALSTIGGFTFQWTFLNDLEMSMVLRAIEKSSKFELVNNQILSVHNTQRAYVTVINQQAYIQDFDVEVAQFQAVADPQINVLMEGVVLDVRPTIHQNRRYLTLEIQPTVAKVIALRNFSTTLGGNTSPVEFQLPEVEVQSVNTSAIIPDGGSILLGGLSSIRNVERRAEVPWLANIPILGFLFKQEGYNDEKESLMILIRAWITDVREQVADNLERGF